MEQVKLSQSLEDYLEMVHMLRLANGIARVRDIAAALKVKMPSVAKAVIELKKLGLVTQGPYSGIELTSEGALVASQILEFDYRLGNRRHLDLERRRNVADTGNPVRKAQHVHHFQVVFKALA